ncbi:hypothetical protein HC723_16025 [Vibrio sp. S11_S32]|uniref:hypothetical protein n=1 Tax=Vibrio sp. S11_S32 TaxID=2720225 RepID=UPI0016813A3E|nr:hypothetical protein [Vibrio sp. S11_S32]MBD1577903.1 hypothetical protein [Vibrio sp. S11_S32]
MQHKILNQVCAFALCNVILLSGCSSTPDAPPPEKLLSSKITDKVSIPDSDRYAENVTKVFQVNADEDGNPICEQFEQTVIGVQWRDDTPIIKYSYTHKPVVCPEME